jgi:hypothetical protein
MDWEMIGSIAELIGATGVILSLLYVGRQLKQSNSMSRSAARQQISAAMNDWAISISSSPTLAEAYSKVHSNDLVYDDASPEERVQLTYSLVAFVGQQQFIYEMWKEGNLSDREAAEINRPGSVLLTKPYFSSVWPLIRASFPSDFVGWFDKKYGLDGNG